ncbi:MAG: amidase [Alphaproteobacteria bacterium]|nr:amidase [Alphaproteobacteria bacterium]
MSISICRAGKDWSPPDDPLGAFCRENHIAHAPISPGPLDGLDFAAKDVMDVIGSTTGFGQPDWLQSHGPASTSAAAVDRLLNAGARLVGRTVSDELSYSLSGENVHYGTPTNPAGVDRIPGGSSSGSVSAVAGGLVDFALGTDCAGSVRLPASYCGVFGMRPTHGRIPATGIIPFAPSFDTLGWFARDPMVLEKVGAVLLDDEELEEPRRLLMARDCFELIDPSVRIALTLAVDLVCRHFGEAAEVIVCPGDLNDWRECFSTIQGAEIWANLGPWICTHAPNLGPGIKERIAFASEVTSEQEGAARGERQNIVRRLNDIVQQGDILCLPSAPRAAPLKGTATSTIEVAYRHQAICLLCVAGLGGLPQVSLPMAKIDSFPLGLSLIGRAGSDLQLLRLARKLHVPL